MLYDALSAIGMANPLTSLDNLSSLEFSILLTPPTGTCLLCRCGLTGHNKPCEVSVYGLRGKAVGLKICLRCDRCKITYNYDRYGNKTRGWSLYEGMRSFVEASDVCYVERKLLELQCSLA